MSDGIMCKVCKKYDTDIQAEEITRLTKELEAAKAEIELVKDVISRSGAENKRLKTLIQEYKKKASKLNSYMNKTDKIIVEQQFEINQLKQSPSDIEREAVFKWLLEIEDLVDGWSWGLDGDCGIGRAVDNKLNDIRNTLSSKESKDD